MARIRTVKPEMWLHPKITSVSRDARLLFVGMLNQADDHGRCELVPRLLLGAIFPDDHDVDESDILAWISQLSREGLVSPYGHRGRRYLCFPGWDEHQRVDKPGKPRCPDPDDDESKPLTSEFGDSRESFASPSRESPNRNVGASERRSVGTSDQTPVDDASASSAEEPADLVLVTEGEIDPGAEPVDEQFERWWWQFPRGPAGKPGGDASKQKSWDIFRKLTQSERDECFVGVEHYREYVERPDSVKTCMATTWLNERRWEQWQEPAACPSTNGRAPKGQFGHDAWTTKAEQLRQQEAAQ